MGFRLKVAFRFLKGGEPDVNTVAKMILNDFQRGKLPYFVPPPKKVGLLVKTHSHIVNLWPICIICTRAERGQIAQIHLKAKTIAKQNSFLFTVKVKGNIFLKRLPTIHHNSKRF